MMTVGADRSSLKSALKCACLCAVSGGVPRRSFYVALVVGTILNVINQGDAIISGGTVNWLKLALTYFVPYAVCTYGAVSAQLMSRAPTQTSETQHALRN